MLLPGDTRSADTRLAPSLWGAPKTPISAGPWAFEDDTVLSSDELGTELDSDEDSASDMSGQEPAGVTQQQQEEQMEHHLVGGHGQKLQQPASQLEQQRELSGPQDQKHGLMDLLRAASSWEDF